MIIEKVIDLAFIPLNLLINMLPSNTLETVTSISFPQIVRWGACFFPLDIALLTVSMWVSWYVIFLAWAIIEWVYKKIPGVS